MSTGKGTKSIRKSQLGRDIIPSVGFLNTVAKHKATVGQTVINLGSLTTPTEATALGFVQPSGATLAAMDLSRYKNNVKVSSTVRGLMDNPLDYRVTGQQQITLQVGAFENEIFTITIESQPRVGTNLVAAQPKVQSYTLLAGNRDIPVGPFTVNRNPGEDVGECMVIIDRVMMYRNTDNSAPGDGVEGDYQELTGIIRMNTADLTNDRRVTLVWVGALVDNPQDSQLALIQTLASQIDILVPTVAALAGVPESTFQSAPNDVDLAAFGAEVIDLRNDLASAEARISQLENNSGFYTPSVVGVSNVSAITARVHQYMKVGKVVTVSGVIVVTATAATSTAIDVGLPITPDVFTDESQGAGSGTYNNGTNGVRIYGRTGFQVLRMDFTSSSSGTPLFLMYTATYRIQ